MAKAIDIPDIGVLDIEDVEDSEREIGNAKPNARKEGKRGRSAFAADICEIHGGTLENPCYKFGHLPGNGRGPYKPTIARKTRSFIVGLIKPLVLIGIVLGALYCGKMFIPNLFDASQFIPSTPSSSNADCHRDGKRDGNRDSNNDGNGGANGIAGTGQSKSGKVDAKRDSGSNPTAIPSSDPCGIGTKE